MPPPRPRPRRRVLAAGPAAPRPGSFVLVALVGALVVGLVWALAAAAQTSTPFPEPLVAPVPSEDQPPPLAVTSFTRVFLDDMPALEVRFDRPVTTPVDDDYRVAVYTGQPDGPRRRATLVVEDGTPTGVLEERDGDDWSDAGPVPAEVTPAGEVVIGVPGLDEDTGDALVWVEVSAETDDGETGQFVTPLFPLGDLVDPVDGALRAASKVWGSTEAQPPASPVEVSGSPAVSVEGSTLTIDYPAPVPTAVGGTGVASVVDVVRIAPSFDEGGEAPYLVAIDHARGTVSLLDGNEPIPAEVPNDGSWLLAGLPPAGVGSGDRLEVDLDAVLEAFEIVGDPDSTALGVARSLTLEDDSVVRADGVLGTLAWFLDPDSPEVAAGPAPPTEAPTSAPDEAASVRTPADESGGWILPVALVSLLLLAGAAGYVWYRWREHDRRGHVGHVIEPVGATRPDADGVELDELTDEIFRE